MKRTLLTGIATLAVILAGTAGANAQDPVDSITLGSVATVFSSASLTQQNISQSFTAVGNPVVVTTEGMTFTDSFNNMVGTVNSVSTGVNSLSLGVVNVNLSFGSIGAGGSSTDGTGTGTGAGAGLAALLGGLGRAAQQ
ncbi:MAG: hypothetical protein QNJ94_17635 [Alphaproteobacteria bacterium]|nr:hypothetical protein [Alphaproteobacteria bacterium]